MMVVLLLGQKRQTAFADSDEKLYQNQVRPGEAEASFISSATLRGPDITTVSIPGVPTVTATGLYNSDYIQVDGAPVDTGDGLGNKAYVKNLDTGNGWVYALGAIPWTDGTSRPVIYESAGELKDGLAYYPVINSGYTTSEGLISYCLQSEFSSPGGACINMVSDVNRMNTRLSRAGLVRAQRIVENGYPLNEAYWAAQGIPAEAQRYATQVAIWCSLRDEPGNSAVFYDTYLGERSKYLTNLAVNGKVVDVLGMIRTLYGCGENGTDVYRAPAVSIEPGGLRINGKEYQAVFTVSSTGNGGFACRTCGVSDPSLQVDGQDVSPDASGWYSIAIGKATEITVRFPVGQTGSVGLNVLPLDTRTEASLWWAQGAGHTGTEGSHAGNTVQDMVVVQTYSFGNPGAVAQAVQNLPQVSVTITKQDAETGAVQGDASLAGGVYGIYRGDGALVQQFPTTDQEGKSEVSGLLPGIDYYVQEISPPDGYQLSVRQYPFCVTDISGRTGDRVSISVAVTDQVIRQRVRLFKLELGRKDVVLPGAGFMFYLKRDVLAASGLTELPLDQEEKIDITGVTLPEPVVIGKDGETELITDEDGAITTIPLLYGEYLVVESSVPETHLAAAPFLISVGKSSDPVMEREVYDEAFQVTLRIIKKDTKGNVIPQSGTGFRLFDPEKNPIVMTEQGDGNPTETELFYTDETGTVVLPEPLGCGQYFLQEAESPIGYASDHTLISVTVSKNGVTVCREESLDETVIPVVWDETRQGLTAEISIYNSPIKVEISKTNMSAENGGCRLPGAALVLSAKNTIYNNDGTVWREAGQVVDSWISDGSAPHELTVLPAGDYLLTEKTAPLGYSVAKPISFTVEACSEVQRIVMEDAASTGHLVVHKYEEAKDGTATVDKPIPGTEFTLYYGADVLDEKGRLIHKAEEVAVDINGDQIIFTTDENGCGNYRGIPIGVYDSEGSFSGYISYILRETKAAEGYKGSNQEKCITFPWGAQEAGDILQEFTFTNSVLEEPAIEKTKANGPKGKASVPMILGITNRKTWLGIGCLLICVMILIITKRRRKKGLL